jgi:hypothetical protein
VLAPLELAYQETQCALFTKDVALSVFRSTIDFNVLLSKHLLDLLLKFRRIKSVNQQEAIKVVSFVLKDSTQVLVCFNVEFIAIKV